MMYPVIKVFKDKYTGEIYQPGRVIELTDEERIADLQERKLIGRAIVARHVTVEDDTIKMDDTPILEHLGGGWYLVNGEKVQGKEAAIEAMKNE